MITVNLNIPQRSHPKPFIKEDFYRGKYFHSSTPFCPSGSGRSGWEHERALEKETALLVKKDEGIVYKVFLRGSYLKKEP